MIQKPRGTIDILPKDVAAWQFIESTARKVAAKFGFCEIRFPSFESTELFHRGVGDTTDVVQKEMYTFTDREGRSLTLRPEGTASVARSLIENGMCSDTMPIKLYYLINCFRYEKPQAGRSREFFQFGVELFGASNAAADAEIIAVAHTLIKELGIKNTSLHINSIGCPKCRPAYRDALKKYFESNKDKLCDTCKTRLETNPLRILDCKSPVCSEIAANAPKTTDNLCDECKTHMSELECYLHEMGIEYEIDPHIVRGLDYYSRTVYEFIASDIGAQSTILGGGRYDGLIKDLGGPDLAGIGFAAGITRLILAMEKSGVNIENQNSPALYIAAMGKDAEKYAMGIVSKLRNEGIYAETDLVGRSLKAQMKYADKKNARYTLIIGDTELQNKEAQLKNMISSDQKMISLEDISQLKDILSAE